MFDVKTLVTLSASLVTGLLCAMLMPIFSLVLVQRYDASAFEVGLFYIGMSTASIIYVQLIAKKSDKLNSRIALIVSAFCSGGIACILFALMAAYWQLLLVCFTLYSFSFVYLSQVLAHTKEYADQNIAKDKVVLFNSVARACFALSWVIGPPLGFLLYDSFGFVLLLTGVGSVHLFAAFFVLVWLPRISHEHKRCEKQTLNVGVGKARALNINLLASIFSFAVLYGTNHSYMLAMPHYLNQFLDLPGTHTGLLMGVAAALEVPVMILGGWLATRLRLLPLLQLGALSAAVAYLGVWHATELWHLVGLQVFNAIFIGLIAGLGMTWLQNLLPNQAGVASAYYSNSAAAGNIFGAAVIAIFAQTLGYKHLYLVNVGFALVAFTLLLFLCKDQDKDRLAKVKPIAQGS